MKENCTRQLEQHTAVSVVVTCTSNKRIAPDSHLQLRNVPFGLLSSRAAEWVWRLEHSEGLHIPAFDLYAGEHWSVVRSLVAVATLKVPVNVWILSAGYGLVRMQALLRPYGATFTNNHPDSVQAGKSSRQIAETRREWWSTLSRWVGPEIGQPRTLTALASLNPGGALIVAASHDYVQAVLEDLTSAREQLDDCDRLMLISCGQGSGKNALCNNTIRCNARLQHTLKGSLIALNVRVLRLILSQSQDFEQLRASIWNRHVADLISSQPILKRYDRNPMDDGALRSYINSELEGDPEFSHSKLLRRFRDSGHACEQGRFRRLFSEVKAKREDRYAETA